MRFIAGMFLGFIIGIVFCSQTVETGMKNAWENKTAFLGYFLEKAIKNNSAKDID